LLLGISFVELVHIALSYSIFNLLKIPADVVILIQIK
jgi:hypothetical protein